MNRPLQRTVLPALAMLCMTLQGAENNDGELGKVSVGNVSLVLEVTEGSSEGFLRTSLDDPDADFQQEMSTSAIESLQQESLTIIPMCIYSSEGGSFAIEPFEYEGLRSNSVQSEFGAAVPVEIAIGDLGRPDTRFRSVREGCDESAAIPITLRTARQMSGREIGRLNGSFNLLIQTE